MIKGYGGVSVNGKPIRLHRITGSSILSMPTMFRKRRDNTDYAQTFDNLTDEVWALCRRIKDNLASDVEFQRLLDCSKELKKALKAYNKAHVTGVPEETVWLATQMVDAAEDISSGYAKLHRLTAG